jgi:hypothetical protein
MTQHNSTYCRAAKLTTWLGSLLLLVCAADLYTVFAQQPSTTQQNASASSQASAPQFAEWIANFGGTQLDPSQWEKFTFEGDPGGSVKVEGGELRMRGLNRSRSGVRTKSLFSGERFIVDATLSRIARRLPAPDSPDDTGFAIVAILFGGSELNRVEWILRSDGRLEAWVMRVGESSEELDNHSLGTKLDHATLGIVRRADEFLFLLNGQVGMQKTIRGMPKDFKVMLYGYGSSENSWKSVRVVIPK